MSAVKYLVVAGLVLALTACGDDPEPRSDGSGDGGGGELLLAVDGLLAVPIALPPDSGPGLTNAGRDWVDAASTVTGIAPDANRLLVGVDPQTLDAAVVVRRDPDASDAYGQQGYALVDSVAPRGVEVRCAADPGCAYGVYELIGALGVRYLHPEQTWFPDEPAASLPQGFTGAVVAPRFELRGFHEHTQHPIVFSDFYLRPEQEFRDYVSNYIRWLVRNRQNAMSWHMLKTVDVDAWLPYVTSFITEAHDHFIDVGMVLSYVDQQQNNFKVIPDDSTDDEADIRATLTQLASAGFDFFTFQIGSSEFTKPADDDVLRWLDVSVEHLDGLDPPVRMYAWIHTTCDLEAEDGSYFYHLPGRADARIGAWPHTTMFYDLERPAPVYGCDSFQQQLDFIDAEEGEREQVYFPETAWWLGFDNNVPLTLPMTGATREYDVQQVLDGRDVTGHITFTSGREWGYWQYDHYLTQLTFDGDLTWEQYLTWMEPAFGEHGGVLVDAIGALTAHQVRHILEEAPLIWFYLAGELRQDEIGERAGILARRPKPAFATIASLDAAEFAAWEQGDFARLQRMLAEVGDIVAGLPEPAVEPATTAEQLYFESWWALQLYALRVEHTVELYSGVADVHAWLQARAANDEAERDALLTAATAHLDSAAAITDRVVAAVAAAEASVYRYPIELLARDKPDSLTAYPFGYLEQTSTAHFWARRDAQLETLIGLAFETIPEAWSVQPDTLFFTDAERTSVVDPDNPLASTVISGFMPRILFALDGFDEGMPGVRLAEDVNENLLPDPATETSFVGTLGDGTWTGTADVFTIDVRGSDGISFGTLSMLSPELTLLVEVADGADPALTAGEMAGEVAVDEFVGLVTIVGGIDPESVENLLKPIFGYEVDDELPATLPITFGFTFEAAP